MKRDIPKLSDAEWSILKPLWEHGPLAARDIYAEVSKSEDWASKTVKTMLARLVKKGALDYDQIGNSYLYRAVYTRDEMTRAAAQTFIHRVFDGGVRPFLAHFAEQASEEELRVLRSEMRRIEEERLGRKGEEASHDGD